LKQFLLFVLVNATLAFGGTYPEMKFEKSQVEIIITNMDQISINDLPGYITINLMNFKQLHIRRNLFTVVYEEMNEVTAYQPFGSEVEIVPGKKVTLVVLKFKFTATTNAAKNLFRDIVRE